MTKSKISKLLIDIILPNTVRTILFIGYFFVTDKLLSDSNLESCEGFELSNTDYLIVSFLIFLISCMYQITFGNWFMRRNKNIFFLTIINSVLFGAFFTTILFGIEISNEIHLDLTFYISFFSIITLLGTLFWILSMVSQKVFKN